MRKHIGAEVRFRIVVLQCFRTCDARLDSIIIFVNMRSAHDILDFDMGQVLARVLVIDRALKPFVGIRVEVEELAEGLLLNAVMLQIESYSQDSQGMCR